MKRSSIVGSLFAFVVVTGLGCANQPVSNDEANDPASTLPNDVEPGDAEPGDVEPGNAEPGDVEPGDVEPGDTQPVEPGAPIPGLTGPVDGSLVDVWNVGDRTQGDQTPAGPLPVSAAASTDHFATRHACADCHTASDQAWAMRDAANRDISPSTLFGSSMMANAARDPIFRAVVSAELSRAPSIAEAIENKCLTCHSPMLAKEAELTGAQGPRLAELVEDTSRARLALDGASCTTCHQIKDEGLGTDESFSAGWTIPEQAVMYGPYIEPFGNPMVNRSGFAPAYGAHIGESKLCATCHTLTTDAYASDGTPLGHQLEEQSPYLEWRNSVFSDEGAQPGAQAASCQDCHLPTTDEDGNVISTRVARRPGGDDFPPVSNRSPYGRHLLVGGNTVAPQLLRDNDELGAPASDAEFNRTLAAAEAQLQERTARVTLSAVAGEARTVRVAIENLVGHKFPSAFPSRRAFLRVQAFDDGGQRVFASGDFDVTGRLLDADGFVLPIELPAGGTEPHHNVIEDDDAVQIYESVMADVEGHRTAALLAATEYLKDNRLLPLGYDSGHTDAARTAPRGIGADADFVGGGDEVDYVLPDGTVRVEAELYYQVLGARFLRELFAWQTPAIDALSEILADADLTPVRVAAAELTF
jgi:hypothetical protein